MSKFAIIENNKVINIIIIEDKNQAEKDLQATLVEIKDTDFASIGDLYINNAFISPNVEEA